MALLQTSLILSNVLVVIHLFYICFLFVLSQSITLNNLYLISRNQVYERINNRNRVLYACRYTVYQNFRISFFFGIISQFKLKKVDKAKVTQLQTICLILDSAYHQVASTNSTFNKEGKKEKKTAKCYFVSKIVLTYYSEGQEYAKCLHHQNNFCIQTVKGQYKF